jgi:hypothetical protein
MRFLIVFLLALGGCQSVETFAPTLRVTETVTIPALPKIQVVQENGTPVLVERNKIISEIYMKFSLIPIEGLNDDHYVLLTEDSYLQCVAYVQYFVDNLGWKWLSEVWDCDNFSEALNFVCKIALAKSIPNIGAEPVQGIIHVNQKFMFAKVPGGAGNHALNFAVVEGYKVIVTEPQNSVSTNLSLYPNKIIKVIF